MRHGNCTGQSALSSGRLSSLVKRSQQPQVLREHTGIHTAVQTQRSRRRRRLLLRLVAISLVVATRVVPIGATLSLSLLLLLLAPSSSLSSSVLAVAAAALEGRQLCQQLIPARQDTTTEEQISC